MITNKLNVYLSGAIKCVNENFQNWRDECSVIEENGFCAEINFVDPNSYFNYTDKLPKTDKQCLDLFMWLVDKCDILLCNLDQSEMSCGTCMEIEHAYCHGIPIISFGSNTNTWYSWAETRSSVIFDTLEEAIEYIYMSYTNI